LKERLAAYKSKLQSGGLVSASELELMIKEEKVQIAMEKMAQASFQKMAVKVFVDEEGTAKTIEIDTGTVRTMHVQYMCNVCVNQGGG
jgi:hypothetical protein